MQPQFKQLFRRMNLDSDVRSLKPGEYRKLINGSPVSPASSSYVNALHDIIANLFGNAIVNYSLPSGTNKAIGFKEDRARNRAFYAVYNSTAANHSIYKYEAGAIALVFRSAFLDFAETDFIDMDIIGDILIFTNNRSEIKKIDVAKAIAGGVYTPTAEEITLIKRPPQLNLERAFFYDNDRETNFIGTNYFQFYYRYVYENDEYSVLSAASSDRGVFGAFAAPAEAVLMVADSNQTLSGLSGTVDGSSKVGGSNILLIGQSSPTQNGVWTMSSGAWSRPSYADTGTEIKALVVGVQSGLKYRGKLFRNTNTTAITLGVTSITFGLTVNANAIDVTINSNEVIPATVKAVEFIVRINGSNEFTVYRIEEKPLVSRTHRFYNDTFLYTVPDTETLRWNDSIPVRCRSLKVFKDRLFTFNNTEGYEFSTDEELSVTIGTNGYPTAKYPVAHPKAGGRYTLAIIFFDNNARLSSPCAYTTIEIPYSFRDASQYPSVVINPSLLTNIPEWATHYSIVATEELDRSYFIHTATTDAYFYKKSFAGVYSYSKTYDEDVVGMALDIRTLVVDGLGYTFSEGDLIRFSALGNRPGSVTTKIIAQDGSFLLTEPIPLFLPVSGQPTTSGIEIYSPKNTSVQSFFEIGNRYAITNPGPSASISESAVIFFGDVVSIYRNRYSDDGSGYSDTDPSTNNYGVSGALYFEAMNTFDQNFPLWVRPGGKSAIRSLVDDKELQKYNYIRFSQKYSQNSSLNGLSAFYALDEYPLPIENGIGFMLAEAGNVLIAIHDIATTALYIGEGFVNTANQNNFLTKTDSVVGDDRKYMVSCGTSHMSSVVARDGRVYYLDIRRGVVVRRSQDGLTIISDYGVRGEISTLCNSHSTLATSRIIGGWDPQYDCYCLSFIDTAGPTGVTFYFHEKSNSWVFQAEIRPEFWGILDQRQFAFLNGALWIQSIEANYNNFFGVQYSRRLEFEISPMQSLVHIWDGVEVDSESIYATLGANEDILLLYHKNGGPLQTKINYLDFQNKEGVWRSSFFRSLNDVEFPNPIESKYKSPLQVRGQSAFMAILYNGTDRNPMKSITLFYTPSMNSSP